MQLKSFSKVPPKAALAAALALALTAAPTIAAPYATDWVEGHNSRARLIVGGAPGPGGAIQRYLALEIAMQPGWKTYWRQPGSAGGIPPQITWTGSVNIKCATLKFPAPTRMVDPTGATIGYKDRVVFPIAIETEFPTRPVVADVKAFFGVCAEICIPAEAAFKVTLGPGSFNLTPPELAEALTRVPAKRNDLAKNKPRLKAVAKSAAGPGKHALVIDVQFPGGSAGADLFAETGDTQGLPEGLPMSEVIARPAPDLIRYRVTIDDAAQWQELAKRGLIVTMVSDAGASETHVKRP